jgi:hypothetical protein
MIPLPGFCEDNKKDNATSGAAAGTAPGEETLILTLAGCWLRLIGIAF